MSEETGSVRIVIAGPPKSGNVWLNCILAHVYDLQPLARTDIPERPDHESFVRWVERGGFREGTIFHQHYRYSPELADAIAAVPAHVVTIVRDPYDAFVSQFFALQSRRDAGKDGRSNAVMRDKPLDHPDVLAYLRDGGCRGNMLLAKRWIESGRTIVVRYEDLHRDPVAALTRVTERIAPVPAARIAHSVDDCSAENMRKMGGGRSTHVRTAKVGDSRDRLNEDHLAIFREEHGDLIRSLGYEVR